MPSNSESKVTLPLQVVIWVCMNSTFSQPSIVQEIKYLVNGFCIVEEHKPYKNKIFLKIRLKANKKSHNMFRKNLSDNKIAYIRSSDGIKRNVFPASTMSDIYSLGFEFVSNIYKKPYEEPHICSWDLVYKTINRPNHGMLNALRKMSMVEHVAPLFGFTNTNYTSKIYIFLMKFAMLFGVVGRESECGFTNNKEAYQRYREKSCEIFEDFMFSNVFYNSVIGISQVTNYMIDYVVIALRLMHSPTKHQTTLVNKMKLVLETCHNLDLFRCSNHTRMKTFHKDLLLKISMGNAHMVPRLMEFSCKAIKTTHDRMMSSFEGISVIDYYQPHGESFEKLSSNHEEALKVIQGVWKNF